MLDPAFDWVKFKKLANDIQRIPSTVDDLKKSELEGLLYYVEHHRREHIVKANDLAMENNCSIDSFLFDPTFEALELTVKNELARREAPELTQSTDNNTPEFCGLFKGLPEQNKAQLFAQELGLVNQSGKWALGERGAKWKIPIFWNLVNDYGLTHWRDDRVEPCQIIAKNWGTTVSKSACYDTTGKGKAAFTEKAKDVLKRLLAD
jgi:hypothetical protein